MKYSWVIVAWIDPTLEDRIAGSDFFTIERNPGFFKPIGIQAERSYRPWLVKPRIEVWQELLRKINRETKGRASNPSSRIALRESDQDAVRHYNFNIRFYRPGTLCIEVKLEESIGDGKDDAFTNRQFEAHRLASIAVDCLIGIISTGHIKGYPTNNSYSAKAAMLLEAPADEELFQVWKNKNKDFLVGLLINNRNYKVSSDKLSEKIFDKNRDLDVKYAKTAFSMISKQGVLTAFPATGPELDIDLKREHLRRFRFLEYALVMQKFIEKFGEIRANNKERADFLLYLCLPFLSEKANLPKTVTGTNTWRILAEEFGLERSVEILEKPFLAEVDTKQKYYVNISQKEYDSLGYLDLVIASTRKHRSWIIRDFSDKKVIPWAIGILVAIGLGLLRFS